MPFPNRFLPIIVENPSQKMFSGDFNWNAVTRQAYWQIKMDKFEVQGTNVTACDQSDGCQVIVDSGTSLLGMIFDFS